MKIFGILVGLLLAQVVFISSSSASDFDWMENLNIKAQADSSGFRVQLATRFHIGDAQVQTVIGNVGRASDAYMVLRLGELTHRPIKEVVNVYHTHRKKGWGVIAKKLGIKPGSKEFHALKRGHDMDNDRRSDHDRPSNKHKNKGKGKGNGMGKGKY